MSFGIANWGPIVATDDVDQAVISVLQEWAPTYINALAQQRGIKLPIPKTYATYIDIDQVMDHQIPAVVVTTAKTRKTTGGANFIYSAEWETTVSAILRGRNWVESKRNTSLVEAAIRRCMVQKCRKSDGILASCHWTDSEVGPVSRRDPRYLAAGMGKYNIATDAAAQSFGGPDVPDAASYAPLAVVTDVVIGVESED